MRENECVRTQLKVTLVGIVSLVLFAVGGISTPADAQTRQITVSAEGKVNVTPDAVRIYATVSLVRDSSKSVLDAASAVSTVVRQTLLANGVERRDLRTQTLTVYPEYNYSQDQGSTLIGYRASQAFDITIRSATNAGAVVDAMVLAGGDDLQVNSVSPFVLNAAEATANARQSAVQNARSKARSYASLLQVKLGRVISLVEGSSPSFGGPVFALEKNDAGSTVIDLGQQEVTVTVTVKWSIR